MRMPSKYILVAVVVVCVSSWFQLSSNPFISNTSRLFKASFGSKNPISFYKLSLQWPRATCSFPNANCPNPLPIPYNDIFTIHGLWPQDANDEGIDPYSSYRNCTTVTPTPPQNLPNYLASSAIYPLLYAQWPDVKKPYNSNASYQFWGAEWSKHGQCSDYPDNPFNYFDSAVRLRHTLTPAFGFKSGQQWRLCQIISMVFSQVNHMPEIACNLNNGSLQLWEIRLCYERPAPGQNLIQNIRDCPNPTGKNGTRCYNKYDSIIRVL